MRINNINTYYRNYTAMQPRFCSTEREIYYPDSRAVLMRNVTGVLRNDIDWFWLAGYIDKNFCDKDKVNIINCACSDGSETDSLAIALKESVPKGRLEKLLPIIASDIDDEMIEIAKSGRINLEEKDFTKLGSLADKYFRNPGFSIDISYDPLTVRCRSYERCPYLKSAAIYKKSDVLTEAMNLKDNGNTVLLFRNASRYLEPDYLEYLIDVLKVKLKQNSLFVIGEYDEATGLDTKLLDKFVYVNKYVMKKMF